MAAELAGACCVAASWQNSCAVVNRTSGSALCYHSCLPSQPCIRPSLLEQDTVEMRGTFCLIFAFLFPEHSQLLTQVALVALCDPVCTRIPSNSSQISFSIPHPCYLHALSWCPADRHVSRRSDTLVFRVLLMTLLGAGHGGTHPYQYPEVRGNGFL